MTRPPVLNLSLVIALACGSTVDAATLFVDANLTTGANDGSSWSAAFQGANGLKSALAVAASGDQIFVAQGTYLPSSTGTRTESFALINGVDILGGFTGTELSPDDRPPFGAAPTILSGDLAGDGNGVGFFTDNSFHIITTVGTNATAVIEGFIVTGGAATGTGSNNRGGGILCLGNVSPTVRHCRFVENRSTFGGAAGYVNNGGAPTFTDCSFEDGVGGSFGGAFDIAGGTAVLFERCLFRGNTAARGGALEIFSSTGPIVDNCVFVNNAATGGSGGGALWLGNGGNTRVRSCTIVGNFATNHSSGGVNSAGSTGATFRNSILWGNVGQAGTSEANAQLSATANTSYCLVAGGVFAGTGNITGDPLFVDAVNEDFALTLTSPAVDSGNSQASLAGVTLDFAGNDRFVDTVGIADTGVGPGAVIDMGALERESSGPFVDLGSSLAGASGAPGLHFAGTLAGGSPLTLTLLNAAPSSVAFFISGATAVNTPLLGGLLVPSPDIVFPAPTGPGGFSVTVTWPSGTPSGSQLFFQAWIDDPTGPFGFTATNAVQGTTP